VGVPDAVLAGRDATQVVDQLVSLSRSPPTRQELVRAGLAALSLEFDPETEDERVLGAVEYLRHVAAP
jgi:hypothetical protein